MSEPAIQVRGISKRYQLGGAKKPYRTLRESLTEAVSGRFKPPAAPAEPEPASPGTFWALQNVSFNVNPGEVVGIIGRNGAGKSTLLKILSRITEPTAGEIDIIGRVGSLLEVGTGFHPELTGRENIYLNGAILGMPRAQIARQFDAIVAFAETEQFLDTPVKYYSSGMYTRLAFAVAAHLEPEILIVDEVLAVGDAEFQRKCMGKMSDVASQGRTVLFVSHNMAAIEKLCGQVVYLKSGRVVRFGQTRPILDEYRMGSDTAAATSIVDRTDRSGDQRARIERIEIFDATGNLAPAVMPTLPFKVRLSGRIDPAITRFQASVDINGVDGTRISTLSSGFHGVSFLRNGGTFSLDCDISGLNLRPDSYVLSVWLGGADGTLDFVDRAATLEVMVSDFFGAGIIPGREHGPLLSNYKWSDAHG